MYSRTLMVAAVLFGILSLAVPAAAQSTDRQGLALTEAQQSQLRALRDQHREAVRSKSDQRRDLYRQLREETLAANPDSTKIATLRGQIATAQSELANARTEFQTKSSAVLTPEQRQRLRDRGMVRSGRRLMEARMGRLGARWFDGDRFGRRLAGRIEHRLRKRNVGPRLRLRIAPRLKFDRALDRRFRRWMD